MKPAIYLLAATLIATPALAQTGAAPHPVGPAGAGPAASHPAPPSPNVADVPAGHYVADPAHTEITAMINHMGFSTTPVTFDGVKATFDFDPAKPDVSVLNVTVDPASLNSGFGQRDDHLKSPMFFNTTAFPTITFKSTHLTKVDATHANVDGELTLLGVTKPVTLAVTFNGTGKGMMGDTRAGFSAKAKLMRSDFGMKGFLPAVGDEVNLDIQAEFAKQ